MNHSTTSVARIIHTAISALQMEPYPTWDEMTPEDRALFKDGVDFVIDTIRDGVPLHPADAHLLWLADRKRNGWTYGPVRDYAKKQHPSMVPFAQLSTLEQVKDALFIHMARTLEPLVAIRD